MRVVTLDSWDKAHVVAKHRVWGSSHNRFAGWEVGEAIIVLVGREGVVAGKVSGPAYRSGVKVWDNDVYERRVPLKSVRTVEGGKGPWLNSSIRTILGQHYGTSIYGYVILNGERLRDEATHLIDGLLRSLDPSE